MAAYRAVHFTSRDSVLMPRHSGTSVSQVYRRCHIRNLVYIKKLCGFGLLSSVCWHFANRQCGETSSKQSIQNFDSALAHATTWDTTSNKIVAKV